MLLIEPAESLVIVRAGILILAVFGVLVLTWEVISRRRGRDDEIDR